MTDNPFLFGVLLLIFNIGSISAILINMTILIFDKTVILGTPRTVMLTNMLLGLAFRLGGIIITAFIIKAG